MNPKRLRARSSATIPKSRWVAYATAGAATTLASVHLAEAEIRYSGPLNRMFADSNPAGSGGEAVEAFAFGPNLIFTFIHAQGGAVSSFAGFRIMSNNGPVFRGSAVGDYRYPSRLGEGVNVSIGNFVSNRLNANNSREFATVASNFEDNHGNFLQPGTGFIGFRFDEGNGPRYGWIRLDMDGSTNGNTFTVVDFAIGDPNEQIATGQIPEPGSLGLLAVGAAGLVAWRKRRARVAA